MSKILVLGANGFIGQNIIKTFLTINKHEVIPHSRNDSSYSSSEFANLLKKVEVVINCTGIGLSKLYKTTQTNSKLTQDICSAIVTANNDVTIFHLSTIKAYNYEARSDPYALDKAQSERVFQDFNLLSKTCILRIPTITGFNDPNFTPFISLLKKFKFPLVKANLPKLNIISVSSLAKTMHNLMNDYKDYTGQIVYILNNNNITWNEFVQSIGKASITLSLNNMKILWFIISIQNYFIKERVPFPKERFNDLFVYDWAIEKSCKTIMLNDDIIDLLRNIDEKKI